MTGTSSNLEKLRMCETVFELPINIDTRTMEYYKPPVAITKPENRTVNINININTSENESKTINISQGDSNTNIEVISNCASTIDRLPVTHMQVPAEYPKPLETICIMNTDDTIIDAIEKPSALLSETFTRFQKSKTIKNVSEQTIKINEYAFKALIEFTGDIAIGEVTDDLIEDFLAHQMKKNSVATACRYFDTMKSFFHYSLVKEILAKNPFDAIEKPKLPKKNVEHLSPEEIQKLIDSCKSDSFEDIRNKSIILLLLDAGLRASELADLKLNDIELNNKTLVVQCGKGAKARTINFGDQTEIALEQYLLKRTDMLKDNVEEFFLSIRGNRLSRHTLADVINNIGKNVGIKIHPHMLRHTCAVSMIKNGGNPFVVQNHLGHATNAMTKHYCQLTGSEQKEAFDKCCPSDNFAE